MVVYRFGHLECLFQAWLDVAKKTAQTDGDAKFIERKLRSQQKDLRIGTYVYQKRLKYEYLKIVPIKSLKN